MTTGSIMAEAVILLGVAIGIAFSILINGFNVDWIFVRGFVGGLFGIPFGILISRLIGD